jgi:hypothetical protein
MGIGKKENGPFGGSRHDGRTIHQSQGTSIVRGFATSAGASRHRFQERWKTKGTTSMIREY